MARGGPIVKIDVIADTKKMTKHLNELQRKTVPKVTMRALNTAAARYQVAAARKIAMTKGLRVGLVKKRLRVRKARKNDLNSRVTGLLLRVLAKNLGKPRQTKTGAKVGKFIFPGAFVQTMPSGKELALKRLGAKRLPIREEGVEIDPPARSILAGEMTQTATPTFMKEFQRLLKAKLQ